MNENTLISIEEFCNGHNIDRRLIITMKEYGLIETVRDGYLHIEVLPKVEKIVRFHSEMEINFEGIEVILNLLEKMETMNEELIYLRNKLSSFDL